MGMKLSAGLGLALLVVTGAFKLYYDKITGRARVFSLKA